jgi:hypothetical protein
MEPQPQSTVSKRSKFLTQLDWVGYLSSGPKNGGDLYALRRQCYKDIENIRKRPLVVYASNFTSQLAVLGQQTHSILLDDIDGFTDLVSKIGNDANGIDVLIHSPGGRADATERIVSILRNKFKSVHFLVPHSAYSAATMLALSGDTITLHPSATLGPIDPQWNGVPARSIIRGFENVKDAIKRDGPQAIAAYIPLLEKYTLDQLEQCNDVADLSKELVKTWLSQYMFAGIANEEGISKTVNYFSDYDEHKIHSRPLLFEKISGFGLAISQSEGELSALLWEAYIVLNGFFSLMPFSKLYEDANYLSFGRQFNVPQQQTPPPSPQEKLNIEL